MTTPTHSPESSTSLSTELSRAQDSRQREFHLCSSISSEIFVRAVPMALSYSFSFSLAAIGILAGHLKDEAGDSSNYVSAAVLITTIMNAYDLFSVSCFYTVSTLVSNRVGALDQCEKKENAGIKEEITSIFNSGFWLTLPFSFIAMALMAAVTKPALLRAGADRVVVDLAYDYLFPYSCALPGLALNMHFEQMMFGFDKQLTAMYRGLLTFGIGLLLAVLLCYGYQDIPTLGLAGIAWMFVLETYLKCVAFGLYLYNGKKLAFSRESPFITVEREEIICQFNFFTTLFHKKYLNQVYKILNDGMALWALIMTEVASKIVLTLYAANLGNNALATLTISSQFSNVISVPLIALSQANGQEVSEAMGRSDIQKAHAQAKYGLASIALIISLSGIIIWLFPRLLMSTVTSDTNPEIEAIADILIRIDAAGVVLDAIRYNIIQVLRAVYDTTVPSYLSLVLLWAGVIPGYFLNSIIAINGCFTAALGVCVILLLQRWYNNVSEEKLLDAAPTPATPCCARFFPSVRKHRNVLHDEHEESTELSRRERPLAHPVLLN